MPRLRHRARGGPREAGPPRYCERPCADVVDALRLVQPLRRSHREEDRLVGQAVPTARCEPAVSHVPGAPCAREGPVHGALLPDAQPRRATSEEWCWWVGGPVAWWPSAQRHAADHRARCPERRGAGGRLGGDPSRFRCSRHVDLSFAISFTRGEGNRVSNRTWFQMVWRGWPAMIAPRLRSGVLRFPVDQEETSEDE